MSEKLPPIHPAITHCSFDNPTKETIEMLNKVAEIVHNLSDAEIKEMNRMIQEKMNQPLLTLNGKTPLERANELCEIVHHTSMGGGWHPFICGRAHKIANEIIAIPNVGQEVIDFYEQVKKELIKKSQL